ncbi:MAG TPA: universal stress protein [Polyangia bacterium]|nr:universal stress protein [Polyangia bacterium]
MSSSESPDATFLIGLDDSAGTERATEVAIELARAKGATLVGLTIVDEPDITAGAAMGIGGSSFKQDRDKALIEDAHRRAREFEALFLERCGKAGMPARVLEITGRPADAILSEMEHHDLLLLGRDANFRFETEASDKRTWDVVVHRATKPVIIVPEEPAPPTRAAVVAYDGSIAAKRALQAFAASGLAGDRPLHVVTVNASGAIAWEVATEAVEALKVLGVAAQLHNVVSVLPLAEALLQTAVKLGADFIVMGAFAHSRLRHLFRGSVTQQLVEKTTIPLFLTH